MLCHVSVVPFVVSFVVIVGALMVVSMIAVSCFSCSFGCVICGHRWCTDGRLYDCCVMFQLFLWLCHLWSSLVH